MTSLPLLTAIAWRNLWRKRSRTLLTILALVITLMSMMLIGALMRAQRDNFTEQHFRSLNSHLHLQHARYLDEPLVDHRIADPTTQWAFIDGIPGVRDWTARIRVPAVLRSEREYRPLQLLGIDPAREAALSFLDDSIVEGRQFNDPEERGIIIGQALAKRLKTKLGRKLIVSAQSADPADQGALQEMGVRVIGIYSFKGFGIGAEEAFAFMSIGQASRLLKADDSISEIAIMANSPEQAARLRPALQAALAEHAIAAVIRDHAEITPGYETQMSVWHTVANAWILISFVVVAFGLVSSLLMSFYERMREFALLQALGLRPGALIIQVLIEAVILLGIALLVGIGLSVLLLDVVIGDVRASGNIAELIGHVTFRFHADPAETLKISLTVLLLGLLASLYPATHAARKTPRAIVTRN